MSTNPHFKGLLAVVAEPTNNYARDSRDQAQWISNARTPGNMPGGCRWTLRTHFDLSGFDPATARIEGQIVVDDFLAEIWLNGKRVAVPAGARDAGLYAKWLRLRIDEAFVAGDNALDIVIENKPDTGSGNSMALCVDWRGTAVPTAARPKAGGKESRLFSPGELP